MHPSNQREKFHFSIELVYTGSLDAVVRLRLPLAGQGHVKPGSKETENPKRNLEKAKNFGGGTAHSEMIFSLKPPFTFWIIWIIYIFIYNHSYWVFHCHFLMVKARDPRTWSVYGRGVTRTGPSETFGASGWDFHCAVAGWSVQVSASTQKCEWMVYAEELHAVSKYAALLGVWF